MLTEAFIFNIEDVLPRQKKAAELFLGRLQPPHNGHAKIINGMRNGWVAIVKGAESSKNKAQNPLPFAYQKKLVNEIAPEVPVIEVPTGYLPDIINEIRKRGQEVETVYAGPDRMEDYQRQIAGVNAKLDAGKQFKVSFKLAERVTSATTVRDAIRNGNQTAFRANVPRAIWKEYGTLRDYLKEDADMKDFKQFLAEITDPASLSVFDAQGVIESRDDGGFGAMSGGRDGRDETGGGRTDRGYSGGRSFDYGSGGRTDSGRYEGGRADEDTDELNGVDTGEMIDTGTALPEAADPIANKLSGGRGDKQHLRGAKPPDMQHQISDKKKPTQSHTQDFLQHI